MCLGKASVFRWINCREIVCVKAILAGDFILSAASMALARIGNTTVVSVLSQVIEDLVRGTACVRERKNVST